MDLDRVLLWLVLVMCGGSIVQIVRSDARRAWAALPRFLIVLGVMGAVYLREPDVAGSVGAGAWALLILAPSLVARAVVGAGHRQRFVLARRLHLLLSALRPFSRDPSGDHYRALELAQRGDFEAARAVLSRAPRDGSLAARQAEILTLRLEQRWEDVRAAIEAMPDPTELEREPGTISVYIRALGETGDLDGMALALARYEGALARPGAASARPLALLSALALSGRRAAVERLFAGPISGLHAETKAFWLATADLAAGRVDEGRAATLALRSSGNALTRRAVGRLLSKPPALASQALTWSGAAIIDGFERVIDVEERFGVAGPDPSRTPRMTHLLIAVNVVFFAAEIGLGGATDDRSLVRLGALVPWLVTHGQPWRLLTASFLHFGWLHLVLNMAALASLGPFVERTLGHARYLVCYLLSGLVATGTVTALALRGWVEADMLVGASGAIMGLVGATAAILLLAWRREGVRFARARLLGIGLALAMQTTFDWMTPEVSMAAHQAGAVGGLLLGLALARRPARA